MEANEARVGVTYSGEYGELPDPVNYDSTDGDVRGWVSEAIRTGGVPGIRSDARVDLADFVIDRFASNDQRPYNLIQVRPKTPFGS